VIIHSVNSTLNSNPEIIDFTYERLRSYSPIIVALPLFLVFAGGLKTEEKGVEI
jgi:hypothetical protein